MVLEEKLLECEVLRGMCEDFLYGLRINGINGTNNLIKPAGDYAIPRSRYSASLRILKIPSTPKSSDYSFDYFIAGLGIPVGFKMNPELNYTVFTLKGKPKFKGYKRFCIDEFGNFGQHKRIKGIAWDRMIREFETLRVR